MTKEARREYGRKQVAAWRAKHPEYLEKARLAARKWYQRHPEESRASCRGYYARHREREAAKQRARRIADPEKARAIHRKHYETHKEQRQTYARAWYWKNRERLKEGAHLRHVCKTYGLTRESYEALGSTCAICGATSSGGKRRFRLHVDHCHETKRVRGLLCHACNMGIGGLRHDPALLLKAFEYLEGGSNVRGETTTDARDRA